MGRRARRGANVERDPQQAQQWVLDQVASAEETLEASRWWAGVRSVLESRERLRSTSQTDIVSLGLGSLEASAKARYQLALLRLLVRTIGSVRKTSIWDPCMTEMDVRAAYAGLADGIEVLVERTCFEPSGHPQRPTLYYMPHCDRHLYSAVLQSAWSPPRLDDIIVFGNSFSLYDVKMFRAHTFVERVMPYTDETPCPDAKCSPLYEAFNDMSIHTFSNLPDASDEAFWTWQPAADATVPRC